MANTFYSGHISADAIKQCWICGDPIDVRKRSNFQLFDGRFVCAKPKRGRSKDIHDLNEPATTRRST